MALPTKPDGSLSFVLPHPSVVAAAAAADRIALVDCGGAKRGFSAGCGRRGNGTVLLQGVVVVSGERKAISISIVHGKRAAEQIA